MDTDLHADQGGKENKNNENPEVVSGISNEVQGSQTTPTKRRNPLMILGIVLGVALLGTLAILLTHALTNEPDSNGQPNFQAAIPNPAFVPDTVLLKFKAGVAQATQDKLIARYGTVKTEIPQIGVKAITVPDEALDSVIDALSHNPTVEFAEKDWKTYALDTTPNDPEWPTQWDDTVTQANKAWDTTTGSANTVIAVIDTGADFTLPDLQGKLLNTGYDFINNDNDPTDDNWHGTTVASVAGAASNNAIGIAGTCWGCMILPIKVMDSNGGGTVDTAASGITYAADHGAKIENMSFAAGGTDRTLDSAIKYAENKGLSLYAAAGNSGSSALVYPAAASGVVGVAGTQYNDTLYSWSDYGSWVKVAAPGCGEVDMPGGGNGTGCGTSFATPVVAGIAGLLWSAKPSATATQIQQAITANTDPCCGGSIGGGRVNALKAMQAILGVTTGGDTTAPTAAFTSPLNGASVSGQVTFSVNATDNVGVTKVELYKGGVPYATTTTAPYDFYWDSTTATNNTSYIFTAKAYDAAGNVSNTASDTVTVNNTVTTADTTAPTATISSPANGSTISGKVSIQAAATDNVGVVEMDVYIDGVLKTTSTSGSVKYSWNTNGKSTKPGQHTITVKAYDAAGNVGTSTITVTK